MKRKKIDQNNFKSNIFDLWLNKWFLLTCGDIKDDKFNAMTVAWGSFGIMWNRPIVQVVVRPTRYTHEFSEKYETFTLSAFAEKYRDDLKYLGTVSGRDEKKIEKCSLTPIASERILAPGYDEAELILECRKIFRSEFSPEQFLDKKIMESYDNDFHTVYFGEIVNISGTSDFVL